MKEQELTQELTDAEMEEFASVSEHWVTGYHAPPPGTVEERFICDHVTIEESLVRDVFRLKSHRGRPLIFEPFCSCDPQFAPPEIVALYPVRKR